MSVSKFLWSLGLLALPFATAAADADWVSIDTVDPTVYYYKQGGSQIELIDFASNVTDVQAIRIVRNDESYIMVLTKTYQKLRLDLYDFEGNRLERTVVRTLNDPYRLGAARLEYVHKSGTSYIQVRYIRVDDTTDQPMTFHRKRFTVAPNQSNKIVLRRTKKTIISELTQPSTEHDSDIVAYVSAARLLSGALPVKHTASIDRGCELHAEYMRLNDEMTHYETEGNPGYTEAGAAAGTQSDITYQYTSSMIYAIDLWLEAPYHRFTLLYPEVVGIGWAMSDPLYYSEYYDKYFGCMNIFAGAEYEAEGYDKNVTYWDYDNHEPLPYPGVNQTAVPLAFNGNESPDPLEDYSNPYPTGYAVSLTFSAGDTITNGDVQLEDSNGNSLDGYLFTPNDPDDANSSHLGNTILFIPTNSLDSNERYTATVSAQRNGNDYTKTWSFTTD